MYKKKKVESIYIVVGTFCGEQDGAAVGISYTEAWTMAAGENTITKLQPQIIKFGGEEVQENGMCFYALSSYLNSRFPELSQKADILCFTRDEKPRQLWDGEGYKEFALGENPEYMEPVTEQTAHALRKLGEFLKKHKATLKIHENIVAEKNDIKARQSLVLFPA